MRIAYKAVVFTSENIEERPERDEKKQTILKKASKGSHAEKQQKKGLNWGKNKAQKVEKGGLHTLLWWQTLHIRPMSAPDISPIFQSFWWAVTTLLGWKVSVRMMTHYHWNLHRHHCSHPRQKQFIHVRISYHHVTNSWPFDLWKLWQMVTAYHALWAFSAWAMKAFTWGLCVDVSYGRVSFAVTGDIKVRHVIRWNA